MWFNNLSDNNNTQYISSLHYLFMRFTCVFLQDSVSLIQGLIQWSLLASLPARCFYCYSVGSGAILKLRDLNLVQHQEVPIYYILRFEQSQYHSILSCDTCQETISIIGFQEIGRKIKKETPFLLTYLCSRSNIHPFNLEFQSLTTEMFSWCFICTHTILNNNSF